MNLMWNRQGRTHHAIALRLSESLRQKAITPVIERRRSGPCSNASHLPMTRPFGSGRRVCSPCGWTLRSSPTEHIFRNLLQCRAVTGLCGIGALGSCATRYGESACVHLARFCLIFHSVRSKVWCTYTSVGECDTSHEDAGSLQCPGAGLVHPENAEGRRNWSWLR